MNGARTASAPTATTSVPRDKCMRVAAAQVLVRAAVALPGVSRQRRANTRAATAHQASLPLKLGSPLVSTAHATCSSQSAVRRLVDRVTSPAPTANTILRPCAALLAPARAASAPAVSLRATRQNVQYAKHSARAREVCSFSSGAVSVAATRARTGRRRMTGSGARYALPVNSSQPRAKPHARTALPVSISRSPAQRRAMTAPWASKQPQPVR